MSTVTIEHAQAHLAELIEQLEPGDAVVITQHDRPVARLLVETPPGPRFGSARGRIQIADDFDAPLEDFKEYSE